MRTINVCPGIGDNIWLLQKLINTGEQFNFNLSASNPRRGKQLFDLLPQISFSCNYIDGLSYQKVKRNSKGGKWNNIKDTVFYLECNSHLESGKRIECFLPDLNTNFILPYITSNADKIKADQLLNYSKPLIGIYGSSYSTSRAWKFWQENEWFNLIQMIGKDYTYILIGAEWDNDLSIKLSLLMKDYSYINTVGQPLPVVVEILKKLEMFIGFPSGLSILNETLGAKQTIMFYPDGKNGRPNLSNVINTWADPERIESGRYKGCLFCEPEKIYKWIKENILS